MTLLYEYLKINKILESNGIKGITLSLNVDRRKSRGIVQQREDFARIVFEN